MDSVDVDRSGTAYLDSAGIAMIFRLAERLSYSRQEFRLVVPPDAPIRAVIRLTKLDQVIPVQDSISRPTTYGAAGLEAIVDTRRDPTRWCALSAILVLTPRHSGRKAAPQRAWVS